jgi:hypothetical protein
MAPLDIAAHSTVRSADPERLRVSPVAIMMPIPIPIPFPIPNTPFGALPFAPFFGSPGWETAG